MFTRAGTSHRFRIVCYGFIALRGIRPSVLLRFIESGEYVWAGSLTEMSWPDRISLVGRIRRHPSQARDACRVQGAVKTG